MIGLSSVVSYPRVDKCLRKNLVPFTDEAKMEFLHLLSSYRNKQVSCNYSTNYCDVIEPNENIFLFFCCFFFTLFI